MHITEDTDLTPDLDPFLVPPGTAVQDGVLHRPPGVKVRKLTLNETFDGYGRLIQLLGTNHRVKGGFGRAYVDPATETPEAGATEVWQIANLTGDTHPIHFHLVNVQVLARQPFDVKVLESRAYIFRDYSKGGTLAGREIQSINGVPGAANSSQLLLRKPSAGRFMRLRSSSASGCTWPFGKLPALKA